MVLVFSLLSALANPPVADRVYVIGSLQIGDSMKARDYSGAPIPTTAIQAAKAAKKQLKENDRSIWLASADGSRVHVHPREAGAPSLKKLPNGLAWGALVGASSLQVPEREIDMVVRDDQKALRPITIRFEGDDVVLRAGSQIPRLAGVVTMPGLEKTYGLELVAQADSFPLDPLRALRHAMQKLSPAEQEVLKGLRVVRLIEPEAKSHIPDGEAWVGYQVRDLVGQIEVYGKPRGRISWFVGPVDAPEHALVFEMLHHLGKAIADRTRSLEGAELLAARKDFEGRKAVLDARYERVEASGSSADRRAFNADLEAMEAELVELNAATQRMNELEHAVAARFVSDLGGLPHAAITRNSRKDVNDAFADAFALFHLDPEALRWVSPEAADWFEAGRHLEPGPG